MLKPIAKAIMLAVFMILAAPLAILTGFGRLPGVFSFFAQCCAMAPGLPGDYLRIAFYRMTLDECSVDSRISFGSFFAQPHVRIAPEVYIGAYCIIGSCVIGDRTLIASGVQVLAGKKQHPRLSDGKLSAVPDIESIRIGKDCWIGAGVILMDDVSDGCTIGAGSIVTRSIPPNSTAAGNPARVIGPASNLETGDTGS